MPARHLSRAQANAARPSPRDPVDRLLLAVLVFSLVVLVATACYGVWLFITEIRPA